MTRLEEIEARKLEIRTEVESAEDEAKIEELNKEVDALNEEVKEIEEHKESEEEAKELEEKSFEVKEIIKEERNIMKPEELRNSKEYINAYAEYIKSGLAKNYEIKEEERALLTTGATNGVVAVPELVDDIVKTAWEREEIMSLVRTISAKGNFQIQFEVSSTGAVEHQEGYGAVDEESLVLGIVTLVPKSIKKWISVSDEVLDMRGEAFLNYIYDELTYRIAKKCADILIGKIAQLPQSLSPNADGIYDKVSAPKINEAVAVGTVAKAYANLSDEATDITIVMNKLTHANFKEQAYANGYGVDPFEGFRVRYNNTLPAYDTAEPNAVYMIVGDFNHGALANYPEGEGIALKYDDKTLMTSDLVRILGRRYVGVEAVADKSFCLVAKPTTSA